MVVNNNVLFDSNYPKLCNQAKAQLVMISEFVWMPKNKVGNRLLNLLAYDLERPDGTFKELPEGVYFLLFFVGDKGIMFTTVRKLNEENSKKYEGNIGEWFEIVVKENK